MLEDRKNLNNLEKFFVIFVIIILSTLIFFLIFLFNARKPLLLAKSQISAVANEAVGMNKIDKYYTFHRRNNYLGAKGKDENGVEVYVLLKENTNKVTILPTNQGITEDKASKLVLQENPKIAKVTGVELGIYGKKTVWEVVAQDHENQYNYYLLDFKNGKIIKRNNVN